MSWSRLSAHLSVAGFVLFVAACHDAPAPTAPQDETPGVQAAHQAPHARQELGEWFAKASPEAMALPQTVFAARDEARGQLVFGVEHEGVIRGVRNVLMRLEIPSSAYTIQVTEPIHFMSETLRTKHRPTVGGIQIHFSNFLCTLGFSVDHVGGRSFITNSHCTDKQGENSGTLYYQPTSSVDSSPIGIEADDPPYTKNDPLCPRNKRCRSSDAARVLYEDGIGSLGEIARTEGGVNSGDLSVAGSFDITSQDDATTNFSGTLNKVGRTTGWTRGNVIDTCANVNVFGSNIHMLCQTLVEESGTQIVGSGDSGSPVFRTTGGGNAELVGILWGGTSGGEIFVFSPLKNIQDELGAMDATTDGTGEGGGTDNGTDNGDDDDHCPPGHQRRGLC